jgi:hypothetical protein
VANFKMQVWNGERVYMVDFSRAAVPSWVPAAQRQHPHRACPDIDRTGYTDDAHADEHGPIIGASVDRGNVLVTMARTEISEDARLYAVSADPGIARVVWPAGGQLPSARAATIVISPRAPGRTSIDIRYFWPDGPVIGRLHVVVRQPRVIHLRIHMVTMNGVGQAASFLGRTALSGETPAQHHANRIEEVIRDANHVLLPHGILLRVRDTVETAWTTAMLGPGPGTGSRRFHRPMALAPSRSATRVNVYLMNKAGVPFAIPFVASGPPVPWARSIGSQYADGAGVQHLGSGVVIDSSYSPLGAQTIAHEFAHVFSLCAMVAAGPSAGASLQWHSDGDQAGAGGNTDGDASRDDIITRRRLMYAIADLMDSEKAWRMDVGYGKERVGTLLTERRLDQDITFHEGQRAYDFAGTAANIYAV